MDIIMHKLTLCSVTELIADDVIITNVSDGADLVGNLYFQGIDKVIIRQENITPGFFDLKTGIAGEVLQKFSNYRIWLAIVGDFTGYETKSLRDFIFECNNGRQVSFVASVQLALEKFDK